tara:strand:- start:51 stop:506 length:456 start_codon:yes stop_codon:yes gene_type:complete
MVSQIIFKNIDIIYIIMRRAIISLSTFSLIIFFYKCFNSEIVRRYLKDTINVYKKNKNIYDKIMEEKKEESPSIKESINYLSESITGIRREELQELLKEIKKVEDRIEVLIEKKEKNIGFSETVQEIKPKLEIKLELEDEESSDDSNPGGN